MPETMETKQLTTADLADAANGRDRQELDAAESRAQGPSEDAIFRAPASRRITPLICEPAGKGSRPDLWMTRE